MIKRGHPSARWAAMRNANLEWAYRAYRRFIDELSDDVRAHLMDGEGAREPYVAVFGKTQVGKTTLLLELMGLESDAQVRVGKVLRGGRAAGKSATATTMEYRRSPDRHWRFDDGAGIRQIDSDAAMCEALGELRDRMSVGRLPAEKPVVVSIPADCFAQGTEGSGPRMLDLPGDNPADEQERIHVERMAARYVPYADLILLVGRGDDLSFLNPDALTLPSIEDWQYVPNRFRIVTTYSFTPDTVRKYAINHEGTLTAEHFRARLREQIDTFGLTLSEEAARSERYFPVEIGQSWQTMLRDDDALARRIGPIVRELKQSLHADIRASATQTARFRNALDVHVVTRRKREACIRQGQEGLARLTNQIDAVDALRQKAMEGKRQAARQASAAQARLAQRAEVEKELAAALAIDPAAQIAKVDQLNTHTSALFIRIDDVTSWLRQRFLDAAPSSGPARKFLGGSRPDLAASSTKVKSIAGREFADLSASMARYHISEYYPSMSDSFSNDKANLKRNIGDAAAKTAALAQKVWREHVASRAAELEAELAQVQGDIANLTQIAAQQQAACNKLKARRDKVNEEMDHALARLDSDECAAARFGSMLDEEYLAELRQRRAHIAEAADPGDALLTLLSVADMGEQRAKIKLS